MGDVTNFRAALAKKNEDNTLWTPQDCAEEFLADIASGEIAPTRVLIIFEEDLPGGNKDIRSYRANLERSYEGYMLTMATYLFQRRGVVDRDGD